MATQEQRNNKIAEVKRTLQRRSLDQLKVYNPLSKSFQTIYDGFIHSAPQGEESTFVRYVAEKWIKEFVDYMINKDQQDARTKEDEKRKKKGFKIMNPEEVLDFDSSNKLLTSNKESRLKYMKMVYRGVSKEYGLDLPEPVKAKKKDQRHPTEILLGQLDKEMGIEHEDTEDTLEDKKDNLVKEISGE